MRWGVFVRDLRDGPEWHERHRWAGGELEPLTSETGARERAAETGQWHPEWETEVRQASDPLPGNFREAFAEFLP